LPRLPPAWTLFLLSPLLAELVSGHLAPLEFLHPLRLLITVVLYGCGVLIAREWTVRRHKGWGSLLLLGLAFGWFLEGIVTRVLLNPGWEGLGALAGYPRLWGIHCTLAAGIVHFQTVIAIVCPGLVSEMLYPERCHESWLDKRALVACCVALPAWTLVLGRFEQYVPPWPGVLVVVLLVAALIALALAHPARPLASPRRPPPRPLAFALVSGIGMTAVMFGTYVVPELVARPPGPVLSVALWGVVVVEQATLLVLSGGGAWDDCHRLTMVAGFLAFFVLFGVAQDIEAFAGRSIVSVMTVWLLARLWQRVRLWRCVGARMEGSRRKEASGLLDRHRESVV
jgi:hypothetical protein